MREIELTAHKGRITITKSNVRYLPVGNSANKWGLHYMIDRLRLYGDLTDAKITIRDMGYAGNDNKTASECRGMKQVATTYRQDDRQDLKEIWDKAYSN